MAARVTRGWGRALAALLVGGLVAAVMVLLRPKRLAAKKAKKKDKTGAIADATIEIQKGSGSGRKKSFSATQKLDLKSDSATASFDVKFDKGFDKNCNGKIGGLFIGKGKASGGKNSDDGASVRFNWAGAGGAFAYVYTPKGTGSQQKGELQKEKQVKLFRKEMSDALAGDGFHNVELGVKLNSVSGGRANNDGTLTLKVKGQDGKVRTASQDGIVWRKNAGVTFDKLQIQPFHGGGSAKCKAAQANSTMQIKNAKVTAGGGAKTKK